MLDDDEERALFGHLRGECRKISETVSAFEAEISALEQPSNQAFKGAHRLRSAPKTARERMDQIASRFKAFRSDTEITLERLVVRMKTFQEIGDTTESTAKTTTPLTAPVVEAEGGLESEPETGTVRNKQFNLDTHNAPLIRLGKS
jgi:hypothetical protein